MSLPKRIKLLITQEDLNNAKGYLSNTDCLLSTAFKRQMNVSKVSSGPSSVRTNEQKWMLSKKNGDILSDVYNTPTLKKYLQINNFKMNLTLDPSYQGDLI